MAIAEIKVVQYYSKEAAAKHGIVGGYRLAALACDCLDSPYEWVKHPAVFRTKERADAFMVKALTSKAHVRLANWGGDAYEVV